jgi:catechol 2,3-dioxygenase-like lactoylglutathione lyase family enzyme
MSVSRVVPNIRSDRFDECRTFYVELLGFEVAMDMGWIMTFVSPTNPTAQISVMRSNDATAPVVPELSVEVADVYTSQKTQNGVSCVSALYWGAVFQRYASSELR